MSARTLLVWGGLDFDTAELDLELREALAAVAPENGALRRLKVTARLRDALDALDEDLGLNPGGAGAALRDCLLALSVARVQLVEANEDLVRARHALGLVSS